MDLLDGNDTISILPFAEIDTLSTASTDSHESDQSYHSDWSWTTNQYFPECGHCGKSFRRYWYEDDCICFFDFDRCFVKGRCDHCRKCRHSPSEMEFRLALLEIEDRQHRLDEDGLYAFFDRHRSRDFEITGRNDYRHEFKDLRSARKARRRQQFEKEKYYGYRGVKRGQLGAEHYDVRLMFNYANGRTSMKQAVPVPEAETTVMNKHMFYQEAQHWPKPPRYHNSHFWDRYFPRHMKRLETKRRLSKDIEMDRGDALEADFQFYVHGENEIIDESLRLGSEWDMDSEFYSDRALRGVLMTANEQMTTSEHECLGERHLQDWLGGVFDPTEPLTSAGDALPHNLSQVSLAEEEWCFICASPAVGQSLTSSGSEFELIDDQGMISDTGSVGIQDDGDE
jgi:hypothetical protein